MELPQNARVAIVDNVYGEVEGLMEALASKGVPVVYYQGQKKFPKLPLSGIRLLFLDLELDGLEGQSDKAKTATAAANASTLIAPGNGPVVIVLWTKHQTSLPPANRMHQSLSLVTSLCARLADCLHALVSSNTHANKPLVF